MLKTSARERKAAYRPALAGSAPAHEGACATPPVPPASASSRCAPWPGAADLAPRDWDDQLHAVCDSLVPLADHIAAPELKSGVLACVAALTRLNTSLAQERARQQQLESDLFDARTALAQARVEIVGSRSDERRARRQALHDKLTTLPNRSFFDEWLEHLLVREAPLTQPLAVLYIDLDGFKAINDAYGHAVGDELLRIVASRLARAVRAEDVISRLGGDEFACLLTNLPDREQLVVLACKLFDAVAAPVKLGLHELAVRPSIGIAMCPTDGASAEALLCHADAAMYHAKRERCGHAFYDQTIRGAA